MRTTGDKRDVDPVAVLKQATELPAEVTPDAAHPDNCHAPDVHQLRRIFS
jgi:hypothetical protein